MINSLSPGSSIPITSLEDCSTNIFQIAEINGLKWCCFTTTSLYSPTSTQSPTTTGKTHSENADPVLRAYVDCLEANLLCTWRRRPPIASTQAAYDKPIPRPDAQKELWIFWYTSEEPKLVEEFKSRGLNAVTHSESTDVDAPRVEFEYETRTLFFKSLNSAIERRLLTEGFIRFGRWLFRPLILSPLYSRDKRAIPRFMNAIRFHYFLHRDSLVCASIIVQKQPTILLLSQSHLNEQSQGSQPVVLAPWSIRAKLLPNQKALLGDFDKLRNSMLPCPDYEEDPSFFSSTLSPEKNDDDGIALKKRLNQLVQSHWSEWKRIYPSLELLYTNSIGNKSFLNNSSNNKRRASGSVVAFSRSNTLTSLPRMVVIQLGGQFLLYPSAFVGIPLDEMIDPFPAKKPGTTTMNEQTCNEILVGNFSDLPENTQCVSTLKSDVRTSKLRRHAYTGLSAARTSFSLGCLRNPKNKISEAELSDPFNYDLQQQRASDFMAEFGYDYMRREFCYCRICPQLGRNLSFPGQSSVPLTQELHKESQSSQHISNALISNIHHHQPNTSFHRLYGFNEQNNSTSHDYPEQQLNSDFLTESRISCRTRTTRARIGSRNLSTMTPATSHSRWMNSIDTALNLPEECQQKIKTSVINKENWGFLNLMNESTNFITKKSKQQLNVDNFNNQINTSSNSLIETVSESHCDIKPSPSNLQYHQLASIPNACASELERMLLGDDDDDDSEQNKITCPSNEGDPLGLLQRLPHHNLQQNFKWRKRKRKWNCFGSNAKKCKNVNWPKISSLNLLNSAFIEESNVFSNNPYSSLPSMESKITSCIPQSQNSPEIHQTSTVYAQHSQSLLMKLLAKSPSTERLEQYQPNEFLNETQPPQDISQQKNSVVAAVSPVHDVEGLTTTSQQQIIDEHIDEYAVTPPALLDTESTIVINHQQEMNVDQLQDQQQMNINAFNFEREVHSASHSSDLYDTPSTSSKYLSLNQQQHHTSQTTILSPPASNERVESVNTGGVPLMQIFHGDISTTSNSTGICTTQPSYSTMSTATTNAILQESMSKIYPTPPTPAQQFSPQNMLLFSHYHLTHQFQTLAQQPLINAEQTIVSILGYFSEQLNHLPWEEPIYESSNHHKAHTRNFYRNMLTNVDNGHEERLIDCIECASILDSMENHNHHNRQLKRVCCEELKRNTSNFIHKTFPNIGVSIPAMELHALAQRRTKADSQLEHRLQMEEQSRFRNFPIISSQPQHMQDFRNFGTIFQGIVQPLHSQNEQFFSGSSLSLGPASNQFVPSTSQQQILSRQTSLTNCGQISTQFQKASLTNTLTHMPSTSNPSPTHISNQQQVISNFSGFISPSNIVTHNHSNIKRLQQSSNIPNDFLLNRRLCNSSLITLLIQDTIADLHYDIVFDACPLCCCNSNIRSFELGFYITSPTDILNRCDYLQQKQKQQHPQALSLKQWSGFRIPPVELQKCICGFSAVRHRYLCGQGSGLFQEDIAEALGVIYAPSQRSLLRNFNHNNLSDCKLIDLIRSLVTSRDVASLVRCRLSLVSDSTPEYFLSSVDGFELNALVNGVLRIFGITQEQQRFLLDEESILHPWGYQNANSIGEPRDAECLGIFDEVCEILRDPSFPPLGPCFSSNGRRFDQLTLRTFARIKNAGGVGSNNRTGEEENGRAEPIPQVIALSCTEREPLLLSPTMIRNWEQLELMPIDQPKDVLYLALAPDVNVLVEKCKVFFEELSSAYERRCRLGSHIRLAIKDAPKDAILRVGRSSLPLNFGYQGFNSLQSLFTQFGFDQQTNDPIVQKFISYMECCKQELQELAKFLTVNDAIFERRALLESIFRQQQIVQTTSLATPPDASAMPPPAMPGGNSIFTSNGQLSNAIGEHANSSTIHQHPSPLSTPGFVNQQQSPAGGSGPNSVPNLHGNVGDGSNAALTMLRTPSGIETAEELAKREDKLAKDMREQVDLLLSKEEQAKRLQLPHVLVIYLINPFGQIASIEQQTNDQNISELFTDFSERFETLANAAFMRAWNDFLSLLSCKRRSQVQLELLPLRKIYDYCTVMGLGGSEQQWDAGWRTSSLDELRRMAFSIYTQPRLLHSTIAQDALSKSMTKFGTAERMKELFLTFGDNMFLLKQNCSPFLLAPERSINFLSNISSNNSSSGSTGISGNIGGISSGQHFLPSSGNKLQLLNSDERILFLAYCLIADGKWLCASVTDERGSLLDTALINLNVPSEDSLPPLEPQKEWRHRERHSQISDALQRLWLFIRSIMLGQEVHHWRLIINRMGKLGHGEFKIWNDLLSKRSLRAYNSSLKNNQSNVDGLPTSASTAFLNNCQACSNSYGWHETPALLSACLVSIEAEPHLRVFGSPSTSFNSLDNQSTGNGGSSNINSTSSNVISSSSNLGSSMNTKSGSSKGTSRHSLLQAQQWAAVQQQLQSSPDDRSLTHIIVFPTILNVSCQQQEDMHGGIDDDVFADFLGNCFSGDGAPDGMELVEDLVFDESARNEEEAPIDNQPMAIGYTITTAPVWPSTSFCRSDISLGSSLSSDCGLSDAFWYNCPPAARYRRLAHLKSSLHINTTNLLQTDDYQQTTGRGNTGAVSNTTAGNTTALTEQLAPNPLDLPNTDDVLRYVLERQNALSWLNLDPVSGSRFSCLPIHMQTIYRLAESFGTIFDFS